MSNLLVYAFAAVALSGAFLVIWNRNPVYSALSLVLTMFSISALYVLMGAYFVAAVQIVVYAGAIMVLFLFVIMLLNLGNQEALQESFGPRALIGLGLGVLFVAIAAGTMWGVLAAEDVTSETAAFEDAGHTERLARTLFQNYLLPFEVVSLILLAGLVGVIILIRFHGRHRAMARSEDSD